MTTEQPRLVKLETGADGIATVTLDRAAARNALNLPMCGELREAFATLDRDPAVRVVLLTANGPVFCAGADLKERQGKDEAWVRQRREASFAAYDTIEKCRKPVVAVVQGPVVGSGGEIAMSCDFIVGFPGEREADFEATLDLVREARYATAFSFKYSPRPGTPASGMAGQVEEPVKTERLARLQALLDEQQIAFNASQVSRVLPVLFEKPGRHDGQLIGRSPYLQSVHATAPQRLIGKIVDVRILSAARMSLAGEVELVAA